MAWEPILVEMVRILVDDIGTTQIYSDERIERSCIIGAYQLLQEAEFSVTYTVDILAASISPDPTATSTLDVPFVNLIALKAACLVYLSEMKTASLNAVKVTDGPSSIDYTKVADHMKHLYDQATKRLEDAIFAYNAGHTVTGKAVLSPYSPGSDSIQGIGRYFIYGR